MAKVYSVNHRNGYAAVELTDEDNHKVYRVILNDLKTKQAEDIAYELENAYNRGFEEGTKFGRPGK